MTLRMIGVILILVSCSSFGFIMAAAYRRQISALQNLCSALDFMECELQFRVTPLPELCRKVSGICKGSVRNVFLALSDELENQSAPVVEICMQKAILKSHDLPHVTENLFSLLGTTLGRFDMDGQIKGIISVRSECKRVLDAMQFNQNERVRSYRTLGICAGVAVAILLI